MGGLWRYHGDNPVSRSALTRGSLVTPAFEAKWEVWQGVREHVGGGLVAAEQTLMILYALVGGPREATSIRAIPRPPPTPGFPRALFRARLFLTTLLIFLRWFSPTSAFSGSSPSQEGTKLCVPSVAPLAVCLPAGCHDCPKELSRDKQGGRAWAGRGLS